jgi:hypothetical protein
MRRAPLHSPHMLAMTFAVIALAFLFLLATAPDLGSLDFSTGSGNAPPAEPAPSSAGSSWLADPLIAPLPEAGPLR